MKETTNELPFNDTVGDTIPPDTPHAVSVSLPTWQCNVSYEEGHAWLLQKMKCGYPRFFIHKSIDKLANSIVRKYGSLETERAMLFPSPRCASRCKAWLTKPGNDADPATVRVLNLGAKQDHLSSIPVKFAQPTVSAVIYPSGLFPIAKAFWQHTGEGISSRRAEFCQMAFDEQTLVEQNATTESSAKHFKGPKRYQRPMSSDIGTPNGATTDKHPRPSGLNEAGVRDSAQFVEERFGRNLHTVFAGQAKLAIRRRIAGSLTMGGDLPESLDQPPDLDRQRHRQVPGFSVNDVYLYPTGMNAIYHAHRALLQVRDDRRSVMYGFPYVDTLKILEKFGPGALFYGHGSASDLDDLERKLEKGDRFLSLFCEFPGNPLLKSPDLKRLRALADKYDFALVIDETIGNMLNVHVLPYADVVVSSLTKVFSGESNVMGGCMILNPGSRFYKDICRALESEYEDTQFEEDSVYLERNSRDFVARIQRINHNAELIADKLQAHPRIKQVHYPKYCDSRPFYDACKLPNGGYGGLLSATFFSTQDAQLFYDHLDTHKGPSLGTNFTLSSPYVILAHYNELDWAAQFGCEASLVRFSVGLEETEKLSAAFDFALAAIPPHAPTAA